MKKIIPIALSLFCALCSTLSFAQEKTVNVKPIKVTGKLNPQKIAQSAAASFSKKYAPNFISEVIQCRTVQQDKRYSH